MTLLDFNSIKIEQLITHYVGNKLRDENTFLSHAISDIAEDTKEHLLNYFLNPFKPIDFQQFTHSVNLDLNEVYTITQQLFSNKVDFIHQSQNLAKLLYEYTNHPNIKDGELNVVMFNDVQLDDEVLDAIGIFKSESNTPFLKMMEQGTNYKILHDFGFELKGIDKGCLIFNTDKELGYKVLAVDSTNKSSEAQYWSNDFLKLTPCSDGYHHTKDYMDFTKEFVTKQLPEEFEVSKTDKIDLLNRTMDYFKNNESFDKETFEENVFQNEGIINSFRSFEKTKQTEYELELNDAFEISSQAVKKQARVYKSVLKLDKNFHVYIHGDKKLIEKGMESDGRKYYKIYYDKET